MNPSINRTVTTIAVSILCCLSTGDYRAEAAETIRINGSGSSLYVMKPLIKAYTKAHPKVRIEMSKPLGSSGAINAVIAGALDIAVSSRVLKQKEVAAGAVSREYGRMPLAIVTGEKVPVTDITTTQLEEIYLGERRAWSNGEPIRLILRPESDIDTTILEGLSPGLNRALKTAHSFQGMIIAVTDPESDKAVAAISGSLGAAALPAILVEKVPLHVLTLNGILPSVHTLANGTYPLGKDIRFITTKNTPGAGLKFIDFIFSSQGRAIAEKAGVLVTTGAKAGK
ncbi:MAG: substrate-binding domain-containing protein [Desulfobacteraceae bacterium]|nr:substrate-binding domain-containing protein [Desulfobacteraceae bacterium]